jgi:hypothetical protein
MADGKDRVKINSIQSTSKFGIGTLIYAPERQAGTNSVDPNCASCCGSVRTCGCSSCASKCVGGCGAATKVKITA